jgi:hypothetical protein
MQSTLVIFTLNLILTYTTYTATFGQIKHVPDPNSTP